MAFFASIIWFAQQNFPRINQKIVYSLKEHLQKQCNSDLKITNISLKWIPLSVQIESLYLSHEQTVIHLQDIQILPDFLKLILDKQLHLKEISVASGNIIGDPSWFEQCLQNDAPAVSKVADSQFPVTFQDILLHDFQISGRIKSSHSALHYHFNKAKFFARYEKKKVLLELQSELSIEIKGKPPLFFEKLSLRAELHGSPKKPQSLFIDTFEIKGKDADISISGKTFFPERSKWPFSEKPAKTIFEINAKSEIKAPAFQMLSQYFQVPLNINGTLAITLQGKGKADDSFAGVDFFEKLSTLEKTDLQANVSFEHFSIDEFHIGDVDLQFRLAQKKIFYEGIVIPTLSPHHNHSGKVYFKGVTETKAHGPSNVLVSAEQINFSNLLENLAVASWVQFFATGKGNFSGTLWPFFFHSSDSQVRVQEFRVYNNTAYSPQKNLLFHSSPITVKGPFNISLDGVALDKVAMSADFGTHINISGDLFFDLQKGMNLRANGDLLNAKDFSPVSSLSFDGTGNTHATLTGPYSSLLIDGAVYLKELQINHLPLGNMKGSVILRDNILSFDSFEGNIQHGNYNFSGEINFNQPNTALKAEANIKNLDLDYLDAFSKKLSDNIDGTINIALLLSGDTNNPYLEYRMYTPKLSAWGVELANYAVSGKYDNTQFSFSWNHRPFANVSSEIAQSFSGNIDMNIDGRINGEASFNNWLLAEMIDHQKINQYHFPRMAGIWSQKAVLTGTLSEPDFQAEGRIDDLSLYEESFAETAYLLHITPQLVTFTFNEKNNTPNRFKIDANISLSENHEFSVSGQILQFNWIPFLDLDIINEKERIDSSVSLDVSIDGQILPVVKLQRGKIEISQINLQSNDYQFQNSGKILIHGDNGHFTLDRSTIIGNLGNLSLNGNYQADNSTFNIHFHGLSYLDKLLLMQDDSSLKGKTNFDGNIFGNSDNTSLELSISLPHTSYSNEEFDLQAEMQNTTLQLHISDLLSQQPHFDSGRLSVQNIQLQSKEIVLKNEQNLIFTLQDDNIILSDFLLKNEKYHISVKGGYNFKNYEAAFYIDSKLPASLFVPKNESININGIVDFQISHAGTFDTPNISGDILLQNGSVLIDELGESISNIEGKVSLKKKNISLQSLDGYYRGERIHIEGEAELSKYKIESLTIRSHIPKIPIDMRDLSLQTGGHLLFTKTGNDYLLSGELDLYQLKYSKNIQWDQLLLKFQEDSRLTPVETIKDQQFFIDVFLKSKDSILLRNSFAEIDLGGTVRIVGTLQHPGLIGELSLAKGEAIFRNRKYRLQKGKITFSGSDKIFPIYTLTADTEACDSIITVTVDGAGVEFPKYYYQSNPQLSANDIPSCLLLGLTTSQLDQSSEGNLSSFGAEALWAISGIENDVEDLIPLSINVTTAYSSISQTFEPRIVATKNILKGQLKLRYDSSLLNTTEQQISAQYLMSQRLSLLSDWNNTSDLSFGNLGFDIHYKWTW